MNSRGQRRPLPEGLRPGERDFFAELRRVVTTARLTTRELERRTSTVRRGEVASVLYSKSQWGRWLNAQAVPPGQAVERLAAVLRAEGIAPERLLALYERTVIPAQRASGEQHSREEDGGLDLPPPRQAPSVTPDFTGRAQELAELDYLADQAGKGGGRGTPARRRR
jgi:hypothetical protein